MRTGKSFSSSRTTKALTSGRRDSTNSAYRRSSTFVPTRFEQGDSSFLYDNWMVHRVYLTYGAQALVANWLQSFKEFPIRQKPASFNLDEVMRKLSPTTN
jgi:arylsulfatase